MLEAETTRSCSAARDSSNSSMVLVNEHNHHAIQLVANRWWWMFFFPFIHPSGGGGWDHKTTWRWFACSVWWCSVEHICATCCASSSRACVAARVRHAHAHAHTCAERIVASSWSMWASSIIAVGIEMAGMLLLTCGMWKLTCCCVKLLFDMLNSFMSFLLNNNAEISMRVRVSCYQNAVHVVRRCHGACCMHCNHHDGWEEMIFQNPFQPALFAHQMHKTQSWGTCFDTQMIQAWEHILLASFLLRKWWKWIRSKKKGQKNDKGSLLISITSMFMYITLHCLHMCIMLPHITYICI